MAASSKGGGASGKGGAGKAPHIPQELREAVELPATGRLFVDKLRDFNSCQLTDVLSMDTEVLPGATWELVIDEEGDGLLYNLRDEDGVQTYRWPHNILKKHCFSTENGERWVQHGSEAPFSLDYALSKHNESQVEMVGASPNAWFTIATSIFVRPRVGGFRIFWPPQDLYAPLGLTCYSRQVSKWTWTCEPAWTKFVKEVTGYSHIVRSSHNNTSQDHRLAPWHERCLLQTSYSTHAYILLLTKFAYVQRTRGGLADENSRIRAGHIMKNMLDTILGKPFSIAVLVMDGWVEVWPRPFDAGGHDTTTYFTLDVDARGEFLLAPLRELTVGDSRIPLAADWFRTIIRGARATEGQQKMHLYALLQQCVCQPSLVSMLGQITRELATLLETTLAHMAKTGQHGQFMKIRKNVVCDASGNVKSLDRKLAQYVLSSADRSLQHTTFATPTDKGQICGLGMQMTLVTYPDNFTALFCPNVAQLPFIFGSSFGVGP